MRFSCSARVYLKEFISIFRQKPAQYTWMWVLLVYFVCLCDCFNYVLNQIKCVCSFFFDTLHSSLRIFVLEKVYSILCFSFFLWYFYFDKVYQMISTCHSFSDNSIFDRVYPMLGTCHSFSEYFNFHCVVFLSLILYSQLNKVFPMLLCYHFFLWYSDFDTMYI